MNAKDLKYERLKVFTYGRFRTKKTRFAGTFPKPIYFFDFDDGMLSLMGEDVEYDTFSDSDLSMPRATDNAEFKINELRKENPYSTVVLDSLTSFGDCAMNKILSLKGRPAGTPQQDDWLPQMTIIKNFIYRMLSLKCNIVVLAHEDTDKDEIVGNIRVTPMVTGKLKEKLPTLFDLVFHSETVYLKDNKTQIRLRVQGTPTYASGPRVNMKEDFIDPDYDIMMKVIKEGAKK